MYAYIHIIPRNIVEGEEGSPSMRNSLVQKLQVFLSIGFL